MKNRYLLLVLALLIAAVIIVLYMSKEQPKSTPVQIDTPRLNQEQSSKASLASPEQSTEPRIAQFDETLSVNSEPEQPTAIQTLIDQLSAPRGLSNTATERAFRLRNFDNFINQLGGALQHKDFEYDFRAALKNAVEQTSSAFQRSAACNDVICAAVFEYTATSDVQTMYKSLVDNISETSSIVIQPVTVSGTQELRVLVRRGVASIVID